MVTREPISRGFFYNAASGGYGLVRDREIRIIKARYKLGVLELLSYDVLFLLVPFYL